jgi:hypothetical protein
MEAQQIGQSSQHHQASLGSEPGGSFRSQNELGQSALGQQSLGGQSAPGVQLG